MSKFKEMKFKVDNPEHSAAIQEELFKMGYKWASGESGVNYTNRQYLYTNIDGGVTYGTVKEYFEECQSEEVRLAQLGISNRVPPTSDFDVQLSTLQHKLQKANCTLSIQHDGIWLYDIDKENDLHTKGIEHVNNLLDVKIKYLELFGEA